MKNWTLTLFALALSFTAFAQPKDKPIYYTDSDVENHFVSFGINFDPLFTQRRLFSFNTSGANNGLTREDYPATGGFGYNWGGYVNFNINSSLRLGIGAGRTQLNFRLDDYLYENNGDTARVGLNTSTLYNTFPIRVGFTTPMNDAWDLEIWIPIAYNSLVSYTENTTFQGMEINEDLTEEARSSNWSVAIQVGGAFYFTDQWAITGSAQFRYFTTPIIDKTDRPAETPYGTGLSLGIRYQP